MTAAAEVLSGLAGRLSDAAGRLEMAGRRWEDGENTQATLAAFLRTLADLIEVRAALQAVARTPSCQMAAAVEELAGEVTVALGYVQTGTRSPAMPADMDEGVARLREVARRLRVLAAADAGHAGHAGHEEGGRSGGR